MVSTEIPQKIKDLTKGICLELEKEDKLKRMYLIVGIVDVLIRFGTRSNVEGVGLLEQIKMNMMLGDIDGSAFMREIKEKVEKDLKEQQEKNK